MKKYIVIASVVVIGIGGILGIYVLKQRESLKKESVVSQREVSSDSKSLIYSQTLPLDIHPDQVLKVRDNQYAVVARPSLNIYFPNIPVQFKAEYRGILQWDDTTKKWEKFLVVEDTNSKISASNNPVDFWFEGKEDTDKVAHLLVVDINGAGSGEGVGKILVPDNLGMDEWKVVECFDYALDFGQGKTRNIESKECQAVKVSRVQENDE